MPSTELKLDTELTRHFAHHSLNGVQCWGNGGQRFAFAHPTYLIENEMPSTELKLGTELTRHFAHHSLNGVPYGEMVGNAALLPTLPT
jgi:hypothetical protein